MFLDVFDYKGVVFNLIRLFCKLNFYILLEFFFFLKFISFVIIVIFCILGVLINLKIKLVEFIIK